jgi:hypothetical protein
MTVSGSTNARIAASVAGTGMPTRSNAVQPEQRLDDHETTQSQSPG